MAIKAILFDMDGVLVDSLRTNFYAFNAAIEKFGKEGISPKKFREEFWGTYIEQGIKAVFGDISRQKLVEIAEEYASQVTRFVEYTRIYPETKGVLTELTKRNLKIGVITNTKRKSVDTIIDQVGLTGYFAIIIYGDEVKKPKPAPDGIIKAYESLGLRPSEVIYVGDNSQDIIAGKSARCLTVGISRTSDREKLEGADVIIYNLTQLIDLAT